MATFTFSVALENAMKKACAEFGMDLVRELQRKYEFPLEEAYETLGLNDISIQKTKKKVSKDVPKKDAAPKKVLPKVPLPFCGVVDDNVCYGIRYNKGLHTQCTNVRKGDADYCATCLRHADSSATNKPKCGDIRDRLKCGLLEFVDPSGRQTLPYANVIHREKLDKEVCIAEAAKFEITIPEEHWVFRVARKGRPKTSDDETTGDKKEKKKVGRPKKLKEMTTVVDTDLLAQMKTLAQDTSDEEEPVSKKSEKKEKKSKKSDAVVSGDEITKTDEEKKKREKKEKKEKKKREKEAKKAKEEEEAKKVVKEEPEPVVEETSELEEEHVGDTDDEATDELPVEEFIFQGNTYYRASDNKLYTKDGDFIGLWNEATEEIERVDGNESDSDEE